MELPAGVQPFLSAEQVNERVASLAQEVALALPSEAREQGVVLVGPLKGACIFMADLARGLAQAGVPLSFDFVKLSSYGEGTVSKGVVTLEQDFTMDLARRHVLLVDDIIDTGRTIAFAQDLIRKRGVASLTTALFLDKPARRVVDVPVDHVGFTIPDEFVVGYGGDLAERFRELPGVGIWVGDQAK